MAQQTQATSAATIGPQPIDGRIGVFQPAPSETSDAQSEPSIASAVNLAAPVISLGKDYLVNAGDLLDIELPDLNNFKRTVRVNAAGAITLPLIGATVVAGLTAQQAERHIADRYAEKYLQNPQVSVFIKEFTTQRITVDGAVARPGIYPLTSQMTLLRVLALAGGFGKIANSTEVKVFRNNEKGERQVAVFNVDEIRAGTADDPVVFGDDLIVVQTDSARKVLKDSLLRDIVDSINPFSALTP